MYIGILGWILGADMGLGMFLGKCLLPVAIGNAIGGACITGAYNWAVYRVEVGPLEDGSMKLDSGGEDGRNDGHAS